MKSYLKYLTLFIILISIGVVGIHLYSNENLSSKKMDKVNLNTNASKKDKNTSKDSTSLKQEDVNQGENQEKGQTVSTEKNEKTNDTEKQKENNQTSQESVSSKGEENATSVSSNQVGTVSSSMNPTDLSGAEDNPTIEVTESYESESGDNQKNNSNDNVQSFASSEDVNVIEVTIDDDRSSADKVESNVSQGNVSKENENTSQDTNDDQADSSDDSSLDDDSDEREDVNSSSSSSTTSGNSSATSESTSSVVGFKTSTDFTKISACVNNRVVRTAKGSNGKTVKIHPCIEKYNLNNKYAMMQNFAITDNYVYFSYVGRGTWVKTESAYQKLGATAALKKTSGNYVVRVDRKTNTYQVGYVEFAGHAQSFDVTEKDEIYMNYFAKLYKGSIGYGAQYSGFTHVLFKENNLASGIELLPESSVYLNRAGTKAGLLLSKDYYASNGSFDRDRYYKAVRTIGKASDKIQTPEVAVDLESDRIALVSKTTAYVYVLSDLNAGRINLVNKFTVSSKDRQGVELYHGSLYIWSGNRTFTLRKYSVSNGKLANSVTFNLNRYYNRSGGIEAEGISIYQGNVYIGIPGNKCNGKTCNDIFLVEGF